MSFQNSASQGLSWTLMAGSYGKTQAVFPKLHLSWPLMDSHGRILCKDSSCHFKTPPLMASHGLSRQDFIYRHKLPFQNSTSHGLSWTLMAESYVKTQVIFQSCTKYFDYSVFLNSWDRIVLFGIWYSLILRLQKLFGIRNQADDSHQYRYRYLCFRVVHIPNHRLLLSLEPLEKFLCGGG